MSTANMEPPGPLINGLPNPTMKAIRVHSFGGPEVLTLEDSTLVEPPGSLEEPRGKGASATRCVPGRVRGCALYPQQ